MQTLPAQEFIWKRRVEDNRVRSPEPTADWRSEVSRTPFSSHSKERKEECGGLPPLRAWTNASLIIGASVYLTKVCCTRIAKLRPDNKTTPSILSLFDVRFGAEASPVNWGTLLPGVHIRVRNLAHSSPVWVLRPRPAKSLAPAGDHW